MQFEKRKSSTIRVQCLGLNRGFLEFKQGFQLFFLQLIGKNCFKGKPLFGCTHSGAGARKLQPQQLGKSVVQTLKTKTKVN